MSTHAAFLTHVSSRSIAVLAAPTSSSSTPFSLSSRLSTSCSAELQVYMQTQCDDTLWTHICRVSTEISAVPRFRIITRYGQKCFASATEVTASGGVKCVYIIITTVNVISIFHKYPLWHAACSLQCRRRQTITRITSMALNAAARTPIVTGINASVVRPASPGTRAASPADLSTADTGKSPPLAM